MGDKGMNCKGFGEKVVVSEFSRHSPGDTEENYEETQPG
jgi:hypothetical protein